MPMPPRLLARLRHDEAQRFCTIAHPCARAVPLFAHFTIITSMFFMPAHLMLTPQRHVSKQAHVPADVSPRCSGLCGV